jgi:aspartate aminotransferase
MCSIVLSDRVKSITPSSTLSINQKTLEMKANGIDVISFSVGAPKFDVPEHIINAGKKAFEERHLHYTPAGGIKELREAVAKRYNDMYGCNFTWKNSIITVGAKHGLFNIAYVLYLPGDEIIVPVPYWVSYPEINKMVGAKNVFVHMSLDNNMVLTAEKVERAISKKTKALLVNTPCNPTGAVIPGKELEKIAELAVKHNFYIIYDECYEKFIFEGDPHVSLASFGKEVRERTLLANSASKTYGLTGLRIGYITGPEEIIKMLNVVQGHQTSNPCSVAQHTVLAALRGRQDFLDDLLVQYKERADFAYKEFNSLDGVKAFKPSGAFYIFPDITELIKKGNFKNDVEFVEELIDKAHISVVPGSAFGMEGFLRFSFVEDINTVKEGIRRFKEFSANL